MSRRFDLVVVGAGPGGIAAATVAAEAGLGVCLLDDNATCGGQLWRGFRAETAQKHPHARGFLKWTSRLRATRCEVWSGWQVIGSPSAGLLRVERDGECRDVRFGKLVLATGARERFLPFPGWTLPGVAGAGGLQALVKSGLDVRNKRIVVAGSGPLLLAVAAGLAGAGAKIVGIYEQTPLTRFWGFALTLLNQPAKLAEGARYLARTLNADFRIGSWVTRAEGRGRVEEISVTNGRKKWTRECDWLACGFHLTPNLELPLLLGCRIAGGCVVVDSLMRSSVPHVACVGELTGIGGVDKALLEGQIAGWSAAGRDAESLALEPRLQVLRRFALRLDRTFALRPELRALAAPETIVCRCEDISHDMLKKSGSWREAKLHTRCGMGACQGRVCGPAAEFLFGWECAGMRPPIFPARVSALAADIDVPEHVDSAH